MDALVAFVRGLIVMLDWCFTVDLLSSHAMSGLPRALRATQATFTQPWLALVLAIAAVLALYHGLIRRRVAETLGQALLMMAMMVGGLWVIMNPAGTVGALGAWANEASLGTLAATVGESPDHPYRTLAESIRMFSAPRSTTLVLPGVRRGELVQRPQAPGPAAARGGAEARRGTRTRPRAEPALLRGARTNGELFLALPANGPARNSINAGWSLFHVLCGGMKNHAWTDGRRG